MSDRKVCILSESTLGSAAAVEEVEAACACAHVVVVESERKADALGRQSEVLSDDSIPGVVIIEGCKLWYACRLMATAA
jgi:hypothetical protein